MGQARLTVTRLAEDPAWTFHVRVQEGTASTSHRVTMSAAMCASLSSGQATPEQMIEAAFRFLLDREPKESILRTFDLTVISQYFPEFTKTILGYLQFDPAIGPRPTAVDPSASLPRRGGRDVTPREA